MGIGDEAKTDNALKKTKVQSQYFFWIADRYLFLFALDFSKRNGISVRPNL